MISSLFSLVAALFVVGAAHANDQELYDPAPPADSSFVRLINATDKEDGGSIGGVTFGKVAAPGASPYYVLKAGEYELAAGGVAEKVKVVAGKYYSFALVPGPKLVTVEDPLLEDPSKAMIYFYNFSDVKAASLRAPSHNTDILAGVGPGQSAAKEINALTLDVAVSTGDSDVATFQSIALKCRMGYAFILSGKEIALKGAMVENSVGK